MDKNYKGFAINFIEEKDLWVCEEASLQNISLKRLTELIDDYEKKLKKEKLKLTPFEAFIVDGGYQRKPFSKITINSAIPASYIYRDNQKIEVWIKNEEGNRSKIHADRIIRADKFDEVKKEYEKLELAKSAYEDFLSKCYYDEEKIVEKLGYTDSQIKKILKQETK